MDKRSRTKKEKRNRFLERGVRGPHSFQPGPMVSPSVDRWVLVRKSERSHEKEELSS